MEGVIGILIADACASDCAPVRPSRLFTAADAARGITVEDSLNDAYRYGILQTLDYYNSWMKVHDIEMASRVFADRPVSGVRELDAAYASLAEYLAARDGWDAPKWAIDAAGLDSPWFPSDLDGIRPFEYIRSRARVESPREFVKRNIYITSGGLERA